MSSKQISKDFIKVDEENFELVESRETTTNINYKIVFKQMESFRKDIKNKLLARKNEEKTLSNAIDTYNLSIQDMKEAKEKLWFDYDMPTEISLDILNKEIDDWQESA